MVLCTENKKPLLIVVVVLLASIYSSSASCVEKIWENEYYSVYEVRYSPTDLSYILKVGENAILDAPILFHNPKVEKNDVLKIYEGSKGIYVQQSIVKVTGTRSMSIAGTIPYSDEVEVYVLRDNKLELFYKGAPEIYKYLELEGVKAIVVCSEDYTCGIGSESALDLESPSYLCIGYGRGGYCHTIYWEGIRISCLMQGEPKPGMYSIALVKGHKPDLAYILAGQQPPQVWGWVILAWLVAAIVIVVWCLQRVFRG